MDLSPEHKKRLEAIRELVESKGVVSSYKAWDNNDDYSHLKVDYGYGFLSLEISYTARDLEEDEPYQQNFKTSYFEGIEGKTSKEVLEYLQSKTDHNVEWYQNHANGYELTNNKTESGVGYDPIVSEVWYDEEDIEAFLKDSESIFLYEKLNKELNQSEVVVSKPIKL